MVNENIMRQQILSCLADAEGIISGEELSRRFGISRVAVWKHIQNLKDSSLRIEATSRGYLLQNPELVFLPGRFERTGRKVVHFQVADSTMETARDLAQAGAAHGSLVVADVQTKGRGRKQRSWVSDRGGLYFTLILRPGTPLAYTQLFGFAAASAISLVLQSKYNLEARVKWPNDVLIEGRKVAGILSEVNGSPEQVSYLNLGIGINVNNESPGDVPSFDSIGAILKRPIRRDELLEAILERFEKETQVFDPERIISRWKSCASTLGRRVTIHTAGDSISGTAVDIDRTGTLILVTEDGSRKQVSVGDCSYRG